VVPLAIVAISQALGEHSGAKGHPCGSIPLRIRRGNTHTETSIPAVDHDGVDCPNTALIVFDSVLEVSGRVVGLNQVLELAEGADLTPCH